MTQRRVRAFLELIDRYAFLERLIQGEIAYELPVHSAVLDDAPVDSPEQAGLLLARAELALQEDTEYPGIDLHEHLDGQGIKIVTVGETGRSPGSGPASETPPAAAPHAAAQMPAGPIEAVFFFEGATGPAFLAGAPKESFLGNFTLAHLYAHLIADVDPYRSRVCRWAADTLENLEDSETERRADAFARALLMPESAVAANLERMAGGPLRGDVLGVLFQVPELIVARRLQELGIDVAGPTPSDALPPDDIAAPGAPGEVAPLELPDRYVNLALAVYAERFMERDLLQQFLGMNELDTQRVVDWAQVPRRDLKSGELKGPVDPDVQ